MVENVDAGRPRTFPALTGLRFFAALAVLMFHYGASFSERLHVPAFASRLLHNGYLGVSLFFVLSGFILTFTYRDRLVNARFLGDFAVARLARIYPVYLAALLLGLPVLLVPLTPASAVKVLLMLQAWTPPSSPQGYAWVTQAWTLSVELFFYILFPLVLPAVRRLGVPACALLAGGLAVAIVVLGSSSVTPSTALWPTAPAWLPLLPALRFLEFLYGALACRLMLKLRLAGSSMVGLLPTAVCILAIVLVLGLSEQPNIKAVATVLFALLIVQLAEGETPIARILGSRVLLLLGGASYAVYLFQGPIRALCARFIRHPFDQFASPVVTLLVAIIIFFVLEQPSRRAIMLIYKRLSGRIPLTNEHSHNASTT